MPVYEFHCNECDNDFELLVSSTKWKGTPCPKCGSKKIAKKLSVFAAAVSPSSRSSGNVPICPTTKRACSCAGPHHRH